MDSRKIQVFLTAIASGSFSKTAEELYCTQSAVTQSMNQLEKELGCKLLKRSHSGVILTPEGASLLPYITTVREAVYDLQNEARRISGSGKNILQIGSFSSIANTILPDIIFEFRKRRPDIDFHVTIATDLLSDFLLNNKINIAFGDSVRLSSFNWYPLMDDEHFAIVHESSPLCEKNSVTLDDIAEYPFIMVPTSALRMDITEKLKWIISVQGDDDRTVISMVSKGVGNTILPGLSITVLPSNVRAIRLNPSQHRNIGVALPNCASKNAKAFCNFVQEHFKNIEINQTTYIDRIV